MCHLTTRIYLFLSFLQVQTIQKKKKKCCSNIYICKYNNLVTGHIYICVYVCTNANNILRKTAQLRQKEKEKEKKKKKKRPRIKGSFTQSCASFICRGVTRYIFKCIQCVYLVASCQKKKETKKKNI